MSITSFAFWIFLIAAVIVYYVIPLKYRWYVLLCASIMFFVMASGWEMLLLLLIIAADTYIGANVIAKAEQKKRKYIIIAVILVALSELTILKYTSFFSCTINLMGNLFGADVYPVFRFVAPLGISYFTLSAIGYVTDVYWEQYEPQRNFLKYLLYILYFPALTSGPIMRYNHMASQLYEGNRFEHKKVLFGIERILWGCFKKLVIADRLNKTVSTIFNDYSTYNGYYIVFATVLFALQLYTDFSGCMDIICGASECFGIYLPENFNAPFFSETVSEFWKRWHITMGSWFQDYLLYPVLKSSFMQKIRTFLKKKFGKKAAKTIPTYIGLIITWICIGIWHGGQYKYLVASGLLPGFYLIMGQVCEPFLARITKALRINTEAKSWHLFRMVRTFFCLCTSWIFVKAFSFLEGLKTIRAIFENHNPWIFTDGSLLQIDLDGKDYNVLWISVLILCYVEWKKYKGSNIRESLAKQNLLFQWIVLLGLLFYVIIFGIYGPNYYPVDFIYQNF